MEKFHKYHEWYGLSALQSMVIWQCILIYWGEMKNLNDAIENVKTSITDKFVAESFDFWKFERLVAEKQLIIKKADLQEGFAFAWINASSEESKLGLAGFWFENISKNII